MNTQLFLQDNTKDLSEVRSSLYKNYVKTVIENSKDKESKRVMFISNRKKSDFTNPISSEMNGIITEYNENLNEWKILMVPTPNFNLSYLKMNNVEQFYNHHLYNVCKAYDGTIINMYYYNDSWRISSNKGYDVTNLPINKEFTYLELFSKLCLNYPGFKMDILDTGNSYTFCMKYNNIHLFTEANFDSDYIILIQSVNLSNMKVSYDESIGFPIQEMNNTLNYRDLFNNSKKSITNFNSSKDSLNYRHNYGYILKSKNVSITQQYSYIYIESKLMKMIKRNIYDYRFLPDEIKQNTPNNFNMTVLNILKYIITNDNDDFMSYFPQCVNVYNTIKKFLLTDLVEHVYLNNTILQSNMCNILLIKNGEKEIINIDNVNIEKYNITEVNNLSMVIASHLYHNNINVQSEQDKTVLKDLLDIKLIYEYYNCIIDFVNTQ